MLNNFHYRDDASLRAKTIGQYYGQLADGLLKTYDEKWLDNRRDANLFAIDFHEEYRGPANLALGADDEEITIYARECAGRCKLFSNIGNMIETCHRVGINPPADDVTEYGAINRMRDFAWWRRRLRRLMAKRVERANIAAGMVHCRADKYVSNDSIERAT